MLNPGVCSGWITRAHTTTKGVFECALPSLTFPVPRLSLCSVEVFRYNLPNPSIASTLALTSIEGAAQTLQLPFFIPDTAVKTGTNVVAVEVCRVGHARPHPPVTGPGLHVSLSTLLLLLVH
jgi:hypothetical protein